MLVPVPSVGSRGGALGHLFMAQHSVLFPWLQQGCEGAGGARGAAGLLWDMHPQLLWWQLHEFHLGVRFHPKQVLVRHCPLGRTQALMSKAP